MPTILNATQLQSGLRVSFFILQMDKLFCGQTCVAMLEVAIICISNLFTVDINANRVTTGPHWFWKATNQLEDYKIIINSGLELGFALLIYTKIYVNHIFITKLL